MRHKNLNHSMLVNSSLIGIVMLLLIIALALSGCAMPTSAPSQQAADSSGGEASTDGGSNGRAATSSERARPTVVALESQSGGDASAPTSSPMPASTAPPIAAAESAAEDEAAEDSYSAAIEKNSTSDSAPAHADRTEPPNRSDRYEPVTAGVVDDNEEWADYLEYRDRRSYHVQVNEREVSERYQIFVQDSEDLPVHDAEVTVYVGDDPIFVGRTDSGGRVLFHPQALNSMSGWSRSRAREFRVTAQKEWVAERQSFNRYDSTVWAITLTDPPAPSYTQLDLLFLMDATGSMGDEIAKLKASMADIADQIYGLPNEPDVRFGLVHYRDSGDAYVVQAHDFTADLGSFQDVLSGLEAEGGGDYPESVNEALHRSLNDLSWRTQERDGETLRLILLVADAPPHLDYHWQDYAYDTDMIAAVQQGIKIFPIGASGLDEQGEYIFRQMAQFTGGKFVFLTYDEGDDPASGPGTETNHDVENYSVNTLDKLVVRLVNDELATLTKPVSLPEKSVARHAYPAPQKRIAPTSAPPRPAMPATCTIDLEAKWNDCGAIEAVEYVDMHKASNRLSNGQAVMKLNLDPRQRKYNSVSFEVFYSEAPQGWTVNIGDSPSNNGYGGDSGDQSNDAEMTLLDGALIVYGNDYTPARATTDGHRELFYQEDMVWSGESMIINVSNEFLEVDSPGGFEVIDSPYLYALARQPDREGRTNYDVYAAFNRTISSSGRNGSGATLVRVVFHPG